MKGVSYWGIQIKLLSTLNKETSMTEMIQCFYLLREKIEIKDCTIFSLYEVYQPC